MYCSSIVQFFIVEAQVYSCVQYVCLSVHACVHTRVFMRGSILVRWSDPGSFHQELSTLCSEPESLPGTWGLLPRQAWQACEPSDPPICFPGTGTASVYHHTHFFYVDVKDGIQVLILTGQAPHKLSHLPSPLSTLQLSLLQCLGPCYVPLVFSLKNFRIFLYVDMFLANFPRFCLHENVFVSLPSVFGRYFFLHVWPLLMIIFSQSIKENFPLFSAFILLRMFTNLTIISLQINVSVLLKCILFWKIVSTRGH